MIIHLLILEHSDICLHSQQTVQCMHVAVTQCMNEWKGGSKKQATLTEGVPAFFPLVSQEAQDRAGHI